MVPLVQEEVVDVHAWLSPEEFTDALAMGNSLPGPIIVKLSVFLGYKIAGVAGAAAAHVFLHSVPCNDWIAVLNKNAAAVAIKFGACCVGEDFIVADLG